MFEILASRKIGEKLAGIEEPYLVYNCERHKQVYCQCDFFFFFFLFFFSLLFFYFLFFIFLLWIFLDMYVPMH